MQNLKSIYWIIARVGGFDGTSLQAFEYMKLLNKLKIKVNIITGLEQTEFGPIDFGQNPRFLIERLSFKHPDSIFLYQNSFINKNKNSEDYQGGKTEWEKVFEKHKEKIKKDIKKILGENNAPIFVHNIISLRHMHPAAAVAIKEIIEDEPDRAFISVAPDSDWERPERVEQARDYVKNAISSSPNDFFGPFTYPNLYHIILNNYQKEVLSNIYNINPKQIHQIPDFLEFGSEELEIFQAPEKSFLDYLS